ncbi:hypothetical protein A6P39_003295 [Streptomyces sp. FXJ1.172]|uniref:hypothetical protein n=1 Tax=Streptomyces sp. FXJ1.172 TaxID=710705 RepID=UPI0023DD2A40|nr:hypothetical protein [Streptomyces sp. FXJ1.172]WEO93163.1 hypothetical protein A6P39_003295 [Streptomyces sp. FXJ1.172]
MPSAPQFHVSEVSSSYWNVTFSNGPINLMDVDTIEQLADLVDRMEQAPDLTVVVFRSDNPDFFMAHFDFLADKSRIVSPYSCECTAKYGDTCTTQATSVSRSMAWSRFLSR